MRPSLVIDRPELQARGQRYGYAAITLIFWFVYLYLWQPLIGLVLWAFGLGLAYHEMVGQGGYLGLVRLLGVYGLIILVLAVVYLGWALINYYRFRGVERRNAQTIVSLQESAEFFGVEPEELSAWRAQRSLVLRHDEHGNVTELGAKELGEGDDFELPCAPPHRVWAKLRSSNYGVSERGSSSIGVSNRFEKWH
ncbi:MAG: poly-beta-1,6-N-acetyl-D-glucosamine biosynthesis protein PgaD [bacterium]